MRSGVDSLVDLDLPLLVSKFAYSMCICHGRII